MFFNICSCIWNKKTYSFKNTEDSFLLFLHFHLPQLSTSGVGTLCSGRADGSRITNSFVTLCGLLKSFSQATSIVYDMSDMSLELKWLITRHCKDTKLRDSLSATVEAYL